MLRLLSASLFAISGTSLYLMKVLAQATPMQFWLQDGLGLTFVLTLAGAIGVMWRTLSSERKEHREDLKRAYKEGAASLAAQHIEHKAEIAAVRDEARKQSEALLAEVRKSAENGV